MCDHRPFRRCEPKEGPPHTAEQLRVMEAERRKKEREREKKENTDGV
jgi:hypothetical protein